MGTGGIAGAFGLVAAPMFGSLRSTPLLVILPTPNTEGGFLRAELEPKELFYKGLGFYFKVSIRV